MASPLSHESYMLLKLLKDGKWHHYDTFLEQLADAVAPGRALRAFQVREETRMRKNPRIGPPPSEEEQIRSGQRTLAQSAVKGMQRNWLEFQGLHHLREVRRRRVPGRLAAEIPPELELEPEESSPVLETKVPEPAVVAAESEPEPVAEEAGSVLTGGQFRAFIADVVREVIREELVDAGRQVMADELTLMSIAMRGWLKERFVNVEELIMQQAPRVEHAVAREMSRMRSPLGLPLGEGPGEQPWKKPKR